MASKTHIVPQFGPNGVCKTLRLRYQLNGRKPAISLGKVSKKLARQFQRYFEQLLEYHSVGAAIPPDLIKEADRLDAKIRDQLIEKGMLPVGLGGTLNEFVSDYIDSRRNVKEATKRKWRNEHERLIRYFGIHKKLNEVTEDDADLYREHLQVEGSLETTGKGLSDAAVNRCCGTASQFFKAAIKKRLLATNPFEDIETKNLANEANFHFVSVEEFDKWIECVPRWQVRLALALGRYAGIRLPSEAVRLRWEDVHWGDGTPEDYGFMMIENVKTKHHSTVQEYRKVPIFPELRPYLEEAYEMSEVGAEWVIEGVEGFDKNRDNPTKPNLRRSALRSLKKAGITPWPDLMVNLRKTRQIELTDVHPQHVVCAWLGNSEDVAKKHYLKVTDGHMASGSLLTASQKVGPKVGPELAVMPSHAVSAKSQTLENKAYHVMSFHVMPAIGGQVGDEGLEPTCVSPTNNRVLRITGIPVGPKVGPNLSLGELTSRLIDRWDGMSDEERRAFEFLADWEEELVLINAD